MGKSIYFGHPLSEYGTPKELVLLDVIKKHFPQYHVENPNQPVHQKKYQLWKDQTGNGMDYFFKVILPGMDEGIFLPFEDGFLGAGVYGEAVFLNKASKPIYEISHRGEISNLVLDSARALSIDQTVARLREAGVILKPHQI